MTSALVEPRPWSRRRWWGMVGLVFGVQLALIFWLGETSLAHRRPAAPGLTLKLAGSASAELLALHDPTLFALPHKQEMPTPTWWRTPQPELHAFAWPKPTNHPHLAIDQLGAAFNRLAETNAFGPLPLPAKPLPELTLPELPPLAISAPRSTLRLEWDQAPQRLLTPLELSSQENPEILSNSVVQRKAHPAIPRPDGSIRRHEPNPGADIAECFPSPPRLPPCPDGRLPPPPSAPMLPEPVPPRSAVGPRQAPRLLQSRRASTPQYQMR